jgi:DNA polymerase-1
MATDTSSPETRAKYKGTELWKPWMEKVRLWQATSIEEVLEFFERHESKKRFSWDVETDALNPHHERVCGHCFSFETNEGVYVPVRHKNHPEMNLDADKLWEILEKELKKRQLVVYNYQFEGRVLKSLGIKRSTKLDDLLDGMIYRWMHNTDEKRIGLKDAAENLLNCQMLEITEVPGVMNGKILDFSRTNPEDATLYAAADPVMTLGVINVCKPIVDKEQLFIVKLEHEILGTTLAIQDNPVTVDRKFLKQAEKDLNHWIEVVTLDIFKTVGREFKLGSPKQVGEVLKEQGVKLKETSKGNLMTGADEIEKLAGEYPFAAKILLYRTLVKERSTYVDALLNGTSDEQPIAVFKMNPTGAPTGRFSGGGTDDMDPLFIAMNPQAIPSANKYEDARCRLLKNPPAEVVREVAGSPSMEDSDG